MFEPGADFLEGYLNTLMGRANLNFAKLIGPSRAICRSARTWRQANNFTQTERIERDPRCFELRFNIVGHGRCTPQEVEGRAYHSTTRACFFTASTSVISFGNGLKVSAGR